MQENEINQENFPGDCGVDETSAVSSLIPVSGVARATDLQNKTKRLTADLQGERVRESRYYWVCTGA